MIALRALALVALLLIPGWLAVSLLGGREAELDNRERIFLSAAVGMGICALCALVLALASVYCLGRLLLLVGFVSVLLALAAGRRALWPRFLRGRDLLLSLALIAVALVLFAAPWAIVFGWSDVGVYPNIAAHIEREGGVSVENSTAASISGENVDLIYYPKQLPAHPDVYFENQFFVIEDLDTGEVRPWFYLLWPSLLAVFDSFLGIRGMFWAITAAAVMAMWGFFLLSKRLVGSRWAVAATALFALSPLTQYFSRYTTSEMMNLVLFLAGSLCMLGYIKADSREAGLSLAVGSAFLLTLGFLCRIDFIFILVPLLLGYLAKRILTGLSARDYWFLSLVAAGAALSMILGFSFSKAYFETLRNSFLGSIDWVISPLGGAVLAAAALLFVLGPRLRGRAVRLFRARRAWIVILWAALASIFVYLYFIRPLGTDPVVNYGFIKSVQGPSYMSQNLIRWGWYFSTAGTVLIFAGYGAWFTRRRDFGYAVLAGVGLAFTLFYAWNMRALPMHILAMRRLIPVIFPMALLVIAYALKSLIEAAGKLAGRRGRYRWSRALAVAFSAGIFLYLLLFFVNAAVPVFGLDEGGNQLELCESIADEVPDEGVVLMDYYSGDLFGPPLRCIYGRENAWLREGTMQKEGGFLGLLEDLGFPDRPVYLLWRPELSGEEVGLPLGLASERVGTLVLEERSLEKSFEHRPGRQESLRETFWLFEIERDGL